MALSGTTIWEVRTGGSDTVNGGAFDPGQTAGMLTDGAATSATTSAPVFTSASYNFVAGDVGAWVYISSGTNWTPGWYKISSVAANAATLNGTAGQGVLKASFVPTTATGCATTGSPTGATWSIDYSQQTAAKFSYTDLVSVGAGLTISSSANPFAKEQVGNAIVVTGGTNFNTGRWVIASVSSGTATLIGSQNVTTGAGVSGTGGQGGCLATPGQSGAHAVGNNACFITSGSYTIASATANIATGCLSWPASSGGSEGRIMGYASVRGDFGTAPVLTASGISTFTIVSLAGAKIRVENLEVNGASLTASKGIANATNVAGTAYKCKASNCTAGGIVTFTAIRCEATGCATTAAIGSVCAIACWAHDNTISGFSTSGTFGADAKLALCVASNNTGASSDGFGLPSSQGSTHTHCTSYASGRDGFRSGNGSTSQATIVNCLAVNSGGYGFNIETGLPGGILFNCAGHNNTSGNVNASTGTTTGPVNLGFVTLTAGPFTSAGTNDFSLNTTSGGGTSLRAAGYPGVFPGGTTTGYLDIGSAQHQDPAGGSGGSSIFRSVVEAIEVNA